MIAVLRKIEAVVFFWAMMLAIVLEGRMVYWSCQQPACPGTSFGLTGESTDAVLAQAWHFGALSMLACRLTTMFRRAPSHPREDALCKRSAFLGLWRWTIALIVMQAFAFFLKRVAEA